MKDYYEVLEVSPDASQSEIKNQYRFLVQAWHPDKFGSTEGKAKAEEKLKQINEAFSVLKDVNKRAEYDRQRQYYQSRSDNQPKREYEQKQHEWKARERAESERQEKEQRESQKRADREKAEYEQKNARQEQKKSESTQSSVQAPLPKGITEVIWLCFIPGSLIGIGAIAGIGLLLGKSWGRKLAIFYLFLIAIGAISAAQAITYEIATQSFSDFPVSWEKSLVLIGIFFFMLIFWIVFNRIQFLYHPIIKDYFFPSSAPHRFLHPTRILNTVGWLHVFLGFWLITPVAIGIGLLVHRRWAWKLANVTVGFTSIFWGVFCVVILLASFFMLSSEFIPIEGLAALYAQLGWVFFVLYSQLWFYLRRADVKALFAT